LNDSLELVKCRKLGGIAQKAPVLAIMLVVVSLANVALPLTNAFIGEFLMFNGIFTSTVSKYNIVFAVLALITIILSAIYTLSMIQKVLYGNTNALTSNGSDMNGNEKLALSIIVVLIPGNWSLSETLYGTDTGHGRYDTIKNDH
jgi:NADH-quinone oxidoreductase subunit M